MANLEDVLETQHNIEASLLKRLNEFEARLNTTTPQTSSSQTSLADEFRNFKSDVLSILLLMRRQIFMITKSIDAIETRHRRKNLLMNGVPENVSNLLDFVSQTLREKLGLASMVPEKLLACHRIGQPSRDKERPVLLRFSEISLKNAVWDKKTSFKGTPFSVSEFLTKQRQTVFIQARKRFGQRRCWTMGGNIVVMLKDGTKRRLYSEQDLAELAKSEDDTQAIPSSASGVASSSPAQHTKSKRTARGKK